MTTTGTLHCSFCGKSQYDVSKLIAGPAAHICGECVELCMDTIHSPSNTNLLVDKPIRERAAIPAKFRTFQRLIDSVCYKPGWYLRTGFEDDRMWVQVGVTEEAEISYDIIEMKRVPWRGAKHWLSEHMCRNEVVTACYYAFERAELHEVKEWFRYKGRSIFNPHLDPDALVEVASKAKNFNVRENAMTMEEPS